MGRGSATLPSLAVPLPSHKFFPFAVVEGSRARECVCVCVSAGGCCQCRGGVLSVGKEL